MSVERRRWLTRTLAIACAAGLAAAAVAPAERMQVGNVRASLDATIMPRTLPREGVAPVKLHVKANFGTADGAPLPQLRRIELVFGSQGTFDTALPVCDEAEIEARTAAQSKRICGAALVGHGRLVAELALPGQPRSRFAAELLAFNGTSSNGQPVILADAHSQRPPVSFVLRFVNRKIEGTGATALVATLPESAGRWAHVKRLELTLGRRFRENGEMHSFVSAGCNAPSGLSSLVFPFAEATYVFAGGKEVPVAAVRRCLVKE